MNSDIYVNVVGTSIVITPEDCLQTSFMQGLLMLTDDFMKNGRPEEIGGVENDLAPLS